jgi:hypothetical protein
MTRLFFALNTGTSIKNSVADIRAGIDFESLFNNKNSDPVTTVSFQSDKIVKNYSLISLTVYDTSAYGLHIFAGNVYVTLGQGCGPESVSEKKYCFGF